MINFIKLVFLRYFPSFSKSAYRKKRWAEDRAYWSSLSPGFGLGASTEKGSGSPRLLIIIPPIRESLTEFGPGAGNYFYEIFRSAQDRYGEQNVAFYEISPDKPLDQECRAVAEQLTQHHFSHVLFYIESYEMKSNLWRWDILGSELDNRKSKVAAIGFLTDGTYELHQLQCSRFQEVYSDSIFLQIDIVPSGKYVAKGRLFGPTFLPISRESISRIRSYLNVAEGAESYGLSFIGKIYGYRQVIIRKLSKSGVFASINPHRPENSASDPSYLDYMYALSRSRFTINFARANGTSQMQLKSRMLESALVGTVPLTDDNGLSELVLPKEIPYLKFTRPTEILNIVELSQVTSHDLPARTPSTSEGMKIIEGIAANHFWETIEGGLLHAGLRALSRESA